MRATLLLLAATAMAAPPTLTDLQPRGAQRGRAFSLTLVGRDLGEGAKIHSTLPATFTPLAPERMSGMSMEGRYASFLVEPKGDVPVGVYPIRVETPDGISNIQFLTIGTFPELAEEESQPGSLPNRNDTVENAQPLPSSPVTVNGTLRGAERDLFRLSAKAGEKRVFEVEARRCGSAIDPVILVRDQSGRMVARSEDAPLLGLDARVEVTFPKEGYYYVEVHDSRFSTQAANFYRLKSGSYAYPTEMFPLGGQRGQSVEVTLGADKVTVNLRQVGAKSRQALVHLPDAAALPLPFAVGDDPEVVEPAAEALAVPVAVNGRLSKPNEADQYRFSVQPGDEVTFQMEARELGTSKLMAVLTVNDDKGNLLGRAGDEPLSEDFFNVNQSRTAGDPFVRVKAPPEANTLTVTVEDLARRGGNGYGYRLLAKRLSADFAATLGVPYINVPAGGSVAVPVTVERRGFDGELALRIPNAPKGLRVEGGSISEAAPIVGRPASRNSRGVLILTAEAGVTLPMSELSVEAVGSHDGKPITRRVQGPGMAVGVTGATQQGSVDRQRALTAPWLALDLPMAGTKPQPAQLAVSLVEHKRLEEGDRLVFRWKWTAEDKMLTLPVSVTAEMVGAADVRVIDSKVDPKDPATGTFAMTTTKLTRPARYDMYVTGKLTVNGRAEDVVSRPIAVLIEEVKSADATATASAR